MPPAWHRAQQIVMALGLAKMIADSSEMPELATKIETVWLAALDEMTEISKRGS